MKSSGGSRNLKLEILGLALCNLVSCIVGVSSQYRMTIGSPEYFDLMAWPVVAAPTIFFLSFACAIYFVLRRSQLKWILFVVAVVLQFSLGAFVGAWMDF
jgi:hypothetical protein